MSHPKNIFSSLVMAAAVITGSMIFGISGCHDNEGKTDSSTAPITSVDSGATVQDTSMKNLPDRTAVKAMDTDTAAKMSMDTISGLKMKTDVSKVKTDKKVKKGKVSVVMNQKVTGTSMEMDKEGYYNNVEVWPAYPGGQSALEKFFEDNIQYPQAATDNGTEGTVNINFAVDEKGKVYAPKVIGQKVGSGIDEEALRVFSKMPAWTPGKVKGKNVKTRFTLPVRFQLTD